MYIASKLLSWCPGKGSPCNLACSGIHAKDCIADECCGGKHSGKDTYTVYYATGKVVLLNKLYKGKRGQNFNKHTMLVIHNL